MSLSCHESAQAILQQSDLFRHWQGPFGAVPVQLLGELKQGQYIYFRARGSKISMQIASSEAHWQHSEYLATFEEPYFDADSGPLQAGLCPSDFCASKIVDWVKLYLANQSAR